MARPALPGPEGLGVPDLRRQDAAAGQGLAPVRWRGARRTGADHLIGRCSICPPLMPDDPVGANGLAGAAPDAVSALDCIQAATLCCLAQRGCEVQQGFVTRGSSTSDMHVQAGGLWPQFQPSRNVDVLQPRHACTSRVQCSQAAQGAELSSIHRAAIGRAVSRSPKESCCSPA